MFKAGDRIRNKNGKAFSNGKHEVTVKRVKDNEIKILETDTTTYILDVEFAEREPSEVEKIIITLEGRKANLEYEAIKINNAIEILKSLEANQ